MQPIRGYAFQEALLYAVERHGARVVEHPIAFTERRTGSSKLRWNDAVEFFRVLIHTRRSTGKLPHPDGIVTWGRLPRFERRFALRLGLALIVITAMPYLIGWAATPPGHTFTGIHALTPGDMTVYVSYLNQVKDGAWLLTDQFTAEQPPRRFLDLFWLSAGLFARATHLPATLAFHVLRLLLIVPFTMFLAVFVAAFIRRPIAGWTTTTVRKTTLCFLTLATGMGAYIAPVLNAQPSFFGSELWPPDLWMAEAYPFLTLLQSPHFIASLWCILAGVLFLLRFRETRRWRWAIALGVLNAAFIQFHPFYAPLVVALPVGWMVVLLLAEHRVPWRMLGASAIATLGVTLAASYHLWLMAHDPITAAQAQQNILPTPPWWIMAFGYGALLPLAVAGIMRMFRGFHAPEQLLAVWLATNAFLLYAPLAWQRRFSEGFFVVLVLIAMVGLFPLLAWVRAHLSPRTARYVWTKGAALALFVPLFSFSIILNLMRDVALYTVPSLTLRWHAVYYPNAAIAAMRWIRANSDPTQATLALNLAGPFIPMYANRTTVVGHGVATMGFQKKIETAYEIAHGTVPAADALAFLRENRARYILVTEDDRADWVRDPATLPGVHVVYANASATVYEVAPSG